MREAGSEAGAIDVDLARLGQVDFFAAWAEILEAASLQRIAQTNRDDFLAVAKSARACAVYTIQKLLVDFGQAAGTQNVPCMNQTVKVR